MKKYDSYKDSGIEWIGEIPSHWEVKRGKEVLNFSNGYPFNSGLFSMDENEGFPLVRIRDLKSDKITTFYKGEIVHEAMIDNNDFIIGMDGDFNIVKWNKGKALLNQRLCKIEGVNHLETNYLSYSLPFYLKIINDLTYYTTVKHLSNNDLFEQKFLVPNSQEQTTIANYLDQKTTQIDDLIAKKERLIQLLEEERTAIINQAVTKGLDPSVPMKDSDIEWLGEIPAHWEVTSLKRLIEVKDGTHDTPNYVEEGIPFITTKDIIKKEISFSQCKFITYEDYEKINKRSDVCIGDIIMPMIGSIGSPIIVNTDTPFSIKNLALIKNNSNCDIRFIRYYLDSELTMFQFELNTSGGVQNFVSLGSLRNLKIPKLTKEEQIKIADFLDFKENQFEECINKINNEIKLLKEYKTALISEVVTGKIDVRNSLK